MPPRSKVSQMPREIREELDRRLIDGAFSDYRGLAAWLQERGVEISVGAVQRHGAQLEERIAQVQASTQMAEALVDASPDDGGAMSEATLRLVQQKMFDLLLKAEESDLKGVGQAATALAKAARANIAVRAERRKALADAAEAADKTAKQAGVPENVIAALRQVIEGQA